MKPRLLLLLGVLVAAARLCADALVPLPDAVAPAVSDPQRFQEPDRVHLGGWVGARFDASERNRLVKLEPARLLEGYVRRPGRQEWDGEYVGKWLYAATLAWVNTRDPQLRDKIDTVARELGRCQLPDGYLGTYLERDRWTSWDVWAHKYNLLGLLAHARYTGNADSLATCRRIGDLLCRTFGDGPGQRDLIAAGTHVGLAPTSVLEPMVLLHRLTGEPRYLEFCRYILRAWEQPNGPHVISTLLTQKRVDRVGNGKAYEMLSCLNGVVELYRTTGERPLLDAALAAWQDIVDKRLYLTGTTSYREYFHGDHDLPPTGNVGETCVTVTWLQLNAQLLRLTGEARFAEQLERTTLNQLLGAQRPDGSGWGYYVQLEGHKPYNDSLDALSCCASSGPRGLALLPTFAVTTDRAGVVVNLFAPARAELALDGGEPVAVELTTDYPAGGAVRAVLHLATPREFSVKLRVPAWCADARLQVNGESAAAPRAGDYAEIRRVWREGDTVALELPLAPRAFTGERDNWGLVALTYGPLVLAADDRLNPTVKIGQFRLPSADVRQLDFRVEQPGQVYSIRAEHRDTGQPVVVRLAPFAEAGCTRETYQVWLEWTR